MLEFFIFYYVFSCFYLWGSFKSDPKCQTNNVFCWLYLFVATISLAPYALPYDLGRLVYTITKKHILNA